MERHRPSQRADHDPADRLSATMRTLEAGISQILDGEAFARYLEAMSRFHAYSYGNVALILAQRPEATQVAGYRRWQQLGRQVRKGEQGIRILVPHRHPVEVDDDDIQDAAATTMVRSFGVGTVFDIAQTEGEPLPEPPAAQLIRSASDAGVALYGALEGVATSHGLVVVREDTRPANGYYAPERDLIALDVDLTGDQAAKTLAHETAHALAGHRPGLRREDAETVAEASAYVVLAHYGIDASGYSFPYVARWAQDRQVLARNLAAIQQTSHTIISAIETVAAPPDTHDVRFPVKGGEAI